MEWRRNHTELLENLYSHQMPSQLSDQGRMRWAGHVALMGKMRNASSILVGQLNGRDHLRELGIDWKIILEWIFG
jgi:hypothetical protein